MTNRVMQLAFVVLVGCCILTAVVSDRRAPDRILGSAWLARLVTQRHAEAVWRGEARAMPPEAATPETESGEAGRIDRRPVEGLWRSQRFAAVEAPYSPRDDDR
jgi:hypothetical protein